MKIFFIIDDTIFFLPCYFGGVLKKIEKKDEVIGVAILTSTSKNTIYSHIVKNLKNIPLIQLGKLFFKFSVLQVKKIFFLLKISAEPITISQVAEKFSLPLFLVENVNDPHFLAMLKKLRVELIISSCSGIFKEEILSIPTYGCINRHSGLLPSYGGLFPVFQALLNKEKQIGVTVHCMTEKIDSGRIICQRTISVAKSDTLFSLYDKSYRESIDATLEAILLLKKKIYGKTDRHIIPSYYSFPKDKDWKTFFNLKCRFI